MAAGLCGGNNYPLRGGKLNFEGGIRVNAFVTGGALPEFVGQKVRRSRDHSTFWRLM